MKLKTIVSPIKLSLGVLSRRMTTAVMGIRMHTVALSIHLVAEVGEFLKILFKTETVTAVDSTFRAVSKPFGDSAVVADSPRLSPIKAPSDSVSIDDGEQLYFAGDYITGAPLAQNYVFSIGRYYTFYKNVLEPALAFDNYAFAMSRILADSALASDSGLVNNQNYVAAPAYFAEDYVGESRVFT